MARQDALEIYVSDSEKDKLAEIYGSVIESVQKGAISEQIKNKNYSGDATSGSVEISRFANAKINDKGTARTAGEGDKLKNNGKVTINVDTDKEIVEEVTKKDLKLHGVSGIAEKRKANHAKRMIAYLDTEFFAKAEEEGNLFTVTGTTIAEKLESLIQKVETTKNDWVDGVDRDMLVITVTPAIYGDLLNYIDSVPNSLTGLKEDYFHKVKIFSNHRQTKDAICMIDGAVGQLVTTDVYDLEKIPLSNDYGLELFFSKGTKAVMPDLIQYANFNVAPVTKYTVTYNVNGGEGNIEAVEVVAGASIELNDGTGITAPEGKEFKGWAKTSTAQNPTVESPFEPTANITLFAVYGE